MLASAGMAGTRRKCEPCRRGDLVACQNPLIPGVTYDGGYADMWWLPQRRSAAIPDSLKSVDAAPLLCAGITTFNALRIAARGLRTPSRSWAWAAWAIWECSLPQRWVSIPLPSLAEPIKSNLRTNSGSRHYIDSTTTEVAAALQKLGGARVILATVTEADAMSAALGGLGYAGKFVVVGVPAKPIQAAVPGMVMQRQSIHGWPSGTAIDSEDTLKFSEITGVLPLIEKYPLERAGSLRPHDERQGPFSRGARNGSLIGADVLRSDSVSQNFDQRRGRKKRIEDLISPVGDYSSA